MTYSGIPKKRRVHVDESGRLVPLGKLSGDSHMHIIPGSGTLLSEGHLTVTGTEFKLDSVYLATYFSTTSGSRPIYVEPGQGTVTFRGDGDQPFYYGVFNLTF